MPRVAARVLPAALAVAVAMALFSTSAVLAKDPDNPNGSHDGLYHNPGHHDGQLKHQPGAPPPNPGPAPNPAPNPQANPPPGSTGQGATGHGATGQGAPAAGAGGPATASLVDFNAGLTVTEGVSGLPSRMLRAIANLTFGAQSSSANARLQQVVAPGPADPQWPLLLVLPLLLAIWLLLFARGALAMVRRRSAAPHPA